MASSIAFQHRLLAALGHVPTDGQHKAIDALERLLSTDKPQATLVLKGYAGTGKTTLVGALVKVLRKEKRSVVLLAPTGRAAKVLESYAHAGASTIHRRIYRVASDEGPPALTLAPNKDEGALFIVDEASMIGMGSGSDSPFGDRDLLSDLFQHVFSANGCKLLLIGDPAQLPPVGSDKSPALDIALLKERFMLTAGSIELTEVVRQQLDSGILKNATALRHILNPGNVTLSPPKGDSNATPGNVTLSPPKGDINATPGNVTLSPLKGDSNATPGNVTLSPPKGHSKLEPRFVHVGGDVVRVEGTGLQDELEHAYAQHGDDEVCLITRSNKRAYQYSQQVRARIRGFEDELNGGDRLMVVRNDYFWAGRNGQQELIANGEQLEVLRVKRHEEKHGFRFAWIDAAWWSGEQRREGEVLVLLDVLALDAPALPYARKRMLNDAILATIEARSKRERFQKLKEDPYANALQVKYAYAVTCHKAQGGQWKSVFVDQGYVTEDMIDREYVRWLYTAITRASEKLYLVNFHPRFFGEEGSGE